MKKWISLLLASMLFLLPVLAVGEAEEEFPEDDFAEEGESLPEEKPENWVTYDYDELTVANPTRLTGQFFTDLWSSQTSDIDVRQLVSAYDLVTWDEDISMFRFDHSVVSGAVIGDDPEGNRRYLISLCDDLFYSDGERITAWDYAFSLLLQCSPIIRNLGGTPANYSSLLGYDAYAAGKTEVLAGLTVVSDYQMVFIVRGETLPYFYELSRLSITPAPIHAIAPGCRVADDGEGVYIANEDANAEKPLWNEETLRSTLLTPDTGYCVHPVPCSGPYEIQSFDGETAIFNLNPWYKGNEDGAKPHIRKITYTLAQNETMMQRLGSGEFGLLNKVTLAETIQAGLELCVNQTQYTRASYPRTGLTSLYFLPSSEKVQQQSVRQAIAHSFDKNGFISSYVGYYGLAVDALYGIGQWMYQLAMGTMGYPVPLPEGTSQAEQDAFDEAIAQWEEITLDNLTTYPLDPEKAGSLLDAAGWKLNAQGEPFTAGTDTLRFRQTENGLQPLELKIAYTEAEELEAPLTEALVKHLAEAGIQATLIPMTTQDLEAAITGQTVGAADLVYLGNNFSAAYNPAKLFIAAEEAVQENEDTLAGAHARLKAMALDMDRTDPKDILTYMQKWQAFQEEVSRQLPVIPVYSNAYFDFYTRELHEYWITDYPTWSQAIVPTRFYDAFGATEEELADLARQQELMSSGDVAGNLSDFLTAHRQKTVPDASAGALASFPAEVQAQVPAEYRTINEFVTATLGEDYQNVREATVQFAFETKYPAGDTVYLLFGLVKKTDDVEWFVRSALVEKNGSISVNMEKELLDKLAGQRFTLVVVSK